MKEKLLKKNNWIIAFVSLGLWGFLLVAIHDVQTAQGVGLYLSMLASRDSRTLFDLGVDAAAMFGAVLLVCIPCFVLRYGKIASALRFYVTFLAFMPTLGLDYLVHLLTGNLQMNLRSALTEGDLWTFFYEGAEYSVSLLQMVLPMFVLLLAALSMEKGKEAIKRWYFAALIVGAVAELGIFLIPNLAQLFGFVMTYIILVIMFDLWEQLMVTYEGFEKWSFILFGGLGLRGIYRLLELMSAFKLQ